jgi:hypothetical protein
MLVLSSGPELQHRLSGQNIPTAAACTKSYCETPSSRVHRSRSIMSLNNDIGLVRQADSEDLDVIREPGSGKTSTLITNSL